VCWLKSAHALPWPCLGPGVKQRQSLVRGAHAGFAAIDALVALLLLASTIALALTAVHVGRRAALAAVEAREASALLAYLLDQPRHSHGTIRVVDLKFVWSIQSDRPLRALGGLSTCRQAAQVTALSSGRTYTATSMTVCPAEAAGT
jgi:hypothetical protein